MSKLVSREENYSEWYNQLVQEAGLAENSSVRWCMVIKPYGYAIWENIKSILDTMFKYTGHYNAYFPLLIPKSFLTREAEHVEHFAKECAIVTHYRLKGNPDWKWLVVDPDAKLDEELIVRPTSETIIWDSYKRWVNSYRDLPILCNQWANIVRWEMRTRIFLRTTEFLWQEWHTAHATHEEAVEEAKKMHLVYDDFARNFMSMSSVLWPKPEHDKFAWALTTYAVEPMMQDFKALQAGTSHDLWQNFGKAFDVKFTNDKNELEHVRWTSWGVSTRLIWWLIMSHSDDQWLVLPPALAPIHVVIVPITKSEWDLEKIKDYLEPVISAMENRTIKLESDYFKKSLDITYKIDDDFSKSPWWKFNERELKWVPLRITVGMRDIENGIVEIYRRDIKEKLSMTVSELAWSIDTMLINIQKSLFEKNKSFRENNTYYVNNYDEFKEKIQKWFVMAHWDWTTETANKIQEETKATIRCIPFDSPDETGVDIITGKPSWKRVLFAKSY